MPKAALKRAGAVMGQPAPLSPEAREAQWLADRAASFCLFGLSIALDERDLARSAERAYRTRHAAAAARPANDGAPAFPPLQPRLLALPASAPTRLMQAIDWAIVALAAELAALWGAGASLFQLSLGQAFAFVGAALALKGGLWLTDVYRTPPGRMRPQQSFGALALGAMGGLVLAALTAPDARAAGALSATLPLAAMLLAGVHAAIALWTRAAHRAGVFAETIVLIGANEAAERLVQRAERTGEARIVAIAEERLSRAPAQLGASPVSGDIDALLSWEGLPHVDRLIITVTQKAEPRVRGLIERLRAAPNRIDLLLDYQARSVRGRGLERWGGAAVACVSGRPRQQGREALKRAFDLVLGGALSALMAAPIALMALAIRLESPGPALERQRRHGFNNCVIAVWTFRTTHGGRQTRVGALLRRFGLDALPQLYNVLSGDMSLVGPCPHAVDMKAADRDLRDIVAEYAHRHRAKPGLTGLAQVSGAGGPIDTAAALRRRVRLDLEYVSRASLWFDLVILARALSQWARRACGARLSRK